MGKFLLSVDTASLDTEFTSIDAEICLKICDIIALLSYAKEYDYIQIEKYYAVIEKINYSNPFEISIILNNIKKITLESVMKRIFFYEQTVKKKDIENETLFQELISKKIDNLKKLETIRKSIASRRDTEQAIEALTEIIVDAKVNIDTGAQRLAEMSGAE